MCQVYGPVHLLRLLTKLGPILTASDMDQYVSSDLPFSYTDRCQALLGCFLVSFPECFGRYPEPSVRRFTNPDLFKVLQAYSIKFLGMCFCVFHANP